MCLEAYHQIAEPVIVLVLLVWVVELLKNVEQFRKDFDFEDGESS